MRWKPVARWPAYEVSDHGDVRRGGHTLRASVAIRGYRYVMLRDRGRRWNVAVHRLVAVAFCGVPTAQQNEVAHGDGCPLNNHWSNLRWATRSDNVRDSIRHGTFRSPRQSRTDEATIAAAEQLVARGLSLRAAARSVGTTHSTVIKSRRRVAANA